MIDECNILPLRSTPAVLNLGYAITSQGVRKQLAVRLKNTQYMAIVVFNLIKIKKLPFLATIN